MKGQTMNTQQKNIAETNTCRSATHYDLLAVDKMQQQATNLQEQGVYPSIFEYTSYLYSVVASVIKNGNRDTLTTVWLSQAAK